ncbi:hypothetical protein B0H13DRAFT_2357738 [Mycena leptocephala]|nr:hypothetical protein B0H13DRAFT_2357738 [Mycena leptocephala]
MDAADDAPPLDPATFARDLRLYRSVVLAGLVPLIYDHTLTLATEVKFIWAAKLRPSIYWFFALRYIGLAANIANCVLYFAELSRAEILVECTLIMRVFAMYGRNWWILVCLLAVFSPALRLLSIICDILVFLLTVRRAYAQPETHPRYTGTLLRRMTTDGAVYFGIIIIANAANLATFYVRVVAFSTLKLMKDGLHSFHDQQLCDILLTGFLSCFIMSLSMMLLARLMLNLHKEAAVGMTTEEPNTIELETLKFETVRMTVDDRA